MNRFFLDGDVGMHRIQRHRGHQRSDGARSPSPRWLKRRCGPARRGLYPGCDASDIEPTEPFQVPYTVFSFDLETSIKHETVQCAACVEHLGTGKCEVFSYRGTEQEILEGLTATVQATDPDIITGYNIDNFDLPSWLTAPLCCNVEVGRAPRPCLAGGVLRSSNPN